ncbi:3-phosphoshikimate 1-carboxyvinyltransferase [Modestobacter sp. I12A-02628]|uniref:3-phosphoshikimate 1-carboxyvinyltransferase n=1 Tax=Goekera deserti TaxID=2497753 RepID=A0A7K3W9H9_9ACTN|nr:3-phosphoshikimate 1-carboxyvinyltransferase [Goekera deserti]MPQ99884.1 3-phosphoshikimate 1-carboxyvinyltransferase [Goekera deserti]NDI50043.1 3-phosphoshikimate 1-carboxyvinyltransferase [Goekera deserti]NEL52480.1 3-phosphoshikimate 1-carboxyvinyltransferase [Goekera deserti]
MTEVWTTPCSPAPVDAVVALPGSKSLTARALVVAALADGPSRLVRPLHARDTDLMVAALRALGVGITADGEDLLVVPGVLRGPATVDAGLAGTVLRFLPPVAALATGPVHLDGDPRLRDRPNAGLIEGLRACGVQVEDGGRGRAPFTVHGTGSVAGGVVTVDASESSQVVSGLLLAAARFERGIDLTVAGAMPSLPHVEMTVATLTEHGVAVAETAGGWQVAPGPIAALDRVVEPDLSNAAPFLAAALVTGGRVTVRDWPRRTTQPGAHLEQLLPRMGATVERTADGLQVRGTGALHGVTADLGEIGELTPVLAALCALADGPSRLTGVAHLRGHETDRLQALDEVLTAVGAQVRQLPDGLEITPGPRRAAQLESYADHRMVHAAAVLGLAIEGVRVADPGAVAKTMPDFTDRWAALLTDPAGVTR